MAKEKKSVRLEGKTCPLSRLNSYYGDTCLEKLCAWWDDITGLCAVAVIARFGAEGAFHVGRREQKADMEDK